MKTIPGDEIELVIVRAPQDLIFISPWNQRVTIPCFENNTRCVAKVVLAERGSRMLLEYPQVALAMVSNVNATNALEVGTEPLTDEQWLANLAEVAKAFGFSPDEVDHAIRALGRKATDPYQLGLVALYANNYPEASKLLTASVTERKQRLEHVKGELADAQMFLGQSYYQQGLYGDSVSAYREAAALRPDDATILGNLGKASLGAGEYG